MSQSTYIDLFNKNIEILDGDNFTKLKGILQNNISKEWLKITITNKKSLIVTPDHPFVTSQGKTMASDLLVGQKLFLSNNKQASIKYIENIKQTKPSFDVETESGMFNFSGIRSYNCRTANGFDINGFGQLKDGRGNIAPTTIILPTLAMEADRDTEKFMSLLNQKIHEAKDSLIDRFEYIASQSPKSAPFMYENKTMAGYIPEEGIRSALKHGTLAIGQLGLAETLVLLIGKDHTTDEGMELAKRIEQLFKDRCAEFKEQYKLNFGVYMTPAENLSHTAMKKFKAKYGIIPNVSDKEYFTNSIHVPVFHKINAFDKMDIESQLTGYSSAGCITYVELDSSSIHNIDAIEKIVNYAMDKDLPYFAINSPNDICMNCGHQEEMNDKCPECGSNNIERLRRVTGYVSTDYHNFNKGKIAEVEDRVKHTGVPLEDEV